MVCLLSVNVNAVAHLRNRRGLPWPNVSEIARRALEAGAHGITVHPRPDGRHIKTEDVFALSEVVRAYPGKEFNVEGNPTEEFLALIETVHPHQVTLVPDAPTQATSDHGYDFEKNRDFLKKTIQKLHQIGTRVSVFIDPDENIPPLARALGADRVEIYTGLYGAEFSLEKREKNLEDIIKTGEKALKYGLGCNAGHDLTLENLPPLIQQLKGLSEVSIGQAFVADCLLYGITDTVARYLTVCSQPT